MEPGGWCDFVGKSAARSYGYAMLSNNAYEDDEKYSALPLNFEKREALSDDKSGLSYSVYDRYLVSGGQRGKIAARVIAFRGTDFGSRADIFSGTLGSSQIELARIVLAAEMADIALSPTPDVTIELTGHSLGGALATQLSIENPGLKAYVFNTSPFFKGDPMASDTDRVSISERGEFLRLLRRYKAPPAAEVLVINCNPSASAGAKHSIRKLADCLTWIAAYREDGAYTLLQRDAIRKPEVECGPEDKEHPGVVGSGVREAVVPCAHSQKNIGGIEAAS